MITMGTPLASSATRCATEGMDLSGGGAGKKDASGLSAAPFERPAAARAGLAEPGGGPGGSNDPTAFDLEAPEPMLSAGLRYGLRRNSSRRLGEGSPEGPESEPASG